MKENPFLCLRLLYEEPETKAIHQKMLQWMEGTLIWGERYHYEKDQALSPATSSGMRAAALEKRRKEPRQ